VHGFHCYDNIAPNAKCQRVLVLALCPVVALLSKLDKDNTYQTLPAGKEVRVF